MKKIFFIATLCFFIFSARYVHAESIVNFHSDIHINDDATVDIAEHIIYDFGNEYRHGIYRDIPVKYTTNAGNRYTARIDNVAVVDENNKEVEFSLMREGDNKRIKIGDPHRTITGVHKYQISYTVHDAITYFDDHQEFYWNVTGDKWPVEMGVVTAIAQASAMEKVDCFKGVYGSTTHCDSIGAPTTHSSGKTIVGFAQNLLQRYEGMTIVVGMPFGTVYQPTFFEKILKFTLDNWILFVPIAVFFFMWRRWQKYGKDPKGRGTVVPYYESPDDLSPAEVGMIIDEKVHSRDVSALLVNLAVQGYIKIKKVADDDDYIFTKTDNQNAISDSAENLLYESLFPDVSMHEKRLSSMKNSFYKKLETISREVVDTVIQKGYYAKNPNTVRTIYMVIGSIVAFSAFFITPVLGFAVSAATFLCAVPIMAFGFFMPRRTKKGAIAREQILGLKMYMDTAEKDRINFHNAPEKKPERFEKLLPYAMALGVETAWAKQFEDMHNAQPEWYESSGAAFSSSLFARDMSNFSSATSSTMASQPASASSGGSGFSGGGSGGGFGGGGGGSW